MRFSTLESRLTLWFALIATTSLCLFGISAFCVVLWEERHESVSDTGSEEDSADEVEEEVLLAMLIAAPLSLANAYIGSRWLARQLIVPVTSVIDTASTMSTRDLSTRLPEPDRHDELHELIVSLNRLFARLEAGFAALDRFSEHVSHELRTPLTVLKSELEFGLRRPRTLGEWESTAGVALSEVERLTRLVESLLLYARAEATATLSYSRVDMRELVDEVVLITKSHAAHRSVTVSVAISSIAGCHVQGNREALVTALANVLRNGIAHTGNAGLVRVEGEAVRDAVAISIRDDGPGVPSDKHEAIFEPFISNVERRIPEGVLEEADGIGLGLTIARRIFAAHGGDIRVENAAPTGARFVVTLPKAPQR